MKVVVLSCSLLMLSLSSCGPIQKKKKSDSTPQPVFSAEDSFNYLIATEQTLTLKSSKTNYKIVSGGVLSIEESTLDGGKILIGTNECLAASASKMVLQNVEVKDDARLCAKDKVTLQGVSDSVPVDQKDIELEETLETQQRYFKIWNKLEATKGVNRLHRNSTLEINLPSDSKVAVIELVPEDLEGAYTVQLKGEPEKTVFIFKGMSWHIDRLQFHLSVMPRSTVYYFPDATDIQISESAMRGSLFAPRAKVNMTSSKIEGSLFARSLMGDGSFYWEPLVELVSE